MKFYIYILFQLALFMFGLSACNAPKSLVLTPTLKEPDKEGFIMQRDSSQTIYTRYMEYTQDFIVFDVEFINQSNENVQLSVDSFRYEIAGFLGDTAQWVNIGIKQPNELSKELRKKVRDARIGQALLIVGSIALEVAVASAEAKQMKNSSSNSERTQQAIWYSERRFDRINTMVNIIGNNAHRIDYLNLDWSFYDKHLIRNQQIMPNGRVVGLVAVPRFDAAQKVRILYKVGDTYYPFEYYQHFK